MHHELLVTDILYSQPTVHLVVLMADDPMHIFVAVDDVGQSSRPAPHLPCARPSITQPPVMGTQAALIVTDPAAASSLRAQMFTHGPLFLPLFAHPPMTSSSGTPERLLATPGIKVWIVLPSNSPVPTNGPGIALRKSCQPLMRSSGNSYA
jgi:hypothetical protein